MGPKFLTQNFSHMILILFCFMVIFDLFAKIGSFGAKTGDFGSFIKEHLKEHVFSIKLPFLTNK